MKFTQLDTLNLFIEGATFSDEFFTNYFRINRVLTSLELESGFHLVWHDLTQAFKTKPHSLKKIVLDNLCLKNVQRFKRPADLVLWRAHNDPNDFQEFDTRALVELYSQAGIDISGDAVDLLRLLDVERSERETGIPE